MGAGKGEGEARAGLILDGGERNREGRDRGRLFFWFFHFLIFMNF